MTVTIVVGPLKTRSEADDTARTLGNQYSVYAVYKKDADGYTTDEQEFFVERDDTIASDRIFGYDAAEFLRRQYK